MVKTAETALKIFAQRLCTLEARKVDDAAVIVANVPVAELRMVVVALVNVPLVPLRLVNVPVVPVI